MTKVFLYMGKYLSCSVAIFLIVAGLMACSQTNAPLAGNQQNTHPIKIGVSLSLSGDFSDDGKALQQGYELWQDAVNQRGGLLGRQVQFDFLKDNSTQAQVTANYQKLISVNHDDLIAGPFSTTLTLAASVVAKRYNYAFVEGAGTGPAIFNQHFNNIFSVSLPATNALRSFVYFILAMPVDLRPKTVAYATSTDFFAEPQVDTARMLLEKGGVHTVLYDLYPAETTNYTPIITKIINAHPDVVILGTTGLSECLPYIKAFKEQHFNPSTILATSGPDLGGQFTGPLGGPQAAEGIFAPNDGWFPAVKSYQNDQFVKSYVAKYGGSPDDISSDTVQAYSAGQVLEQAIKKSNSLDNARLIQELHSDTFNTLQGVVKFDGDGRNTLAVAFLFQWQNGKLVVVFPSSSAQNNPEFPKHPWP